MSTKTVFTTVWDSERERDSPSNAEPITTYLCVARKCATVAHIFFQVAFSSFLSTTFHRLPLRKYKKKNNTANHFRKESIASEEVHAENGSAQVSFLPLECGYCSQALQTEEGTRKYMFGKYVFRVTVFIFSFFRGAENERGQCNGQCH